MSNPIVQQLNPSQRRAVQTVDGPVLIIAGPGSGKTMVITHRIAYLVDTIQISPFQILAVTFTNKAANEMRDRLVNLIRGKAHAVTVKTFHAFCSSVLRQHGKHMGLGSDYTIFDSEDQRDALKMAMEEVEVDPKRYPIRGIQSAISRAKSTMLDVHRFKTKGQSFYDEIVGRVYGSYERILSANNGVDFDDLLLKTINVFNGQPSVLEQYQKRFFHVMVDEFQDTNIVQYQLAKILSGSFRNLCVVGDPDQAIYSWRNADIRNILSFQQDFPDAAFIELEENYRSTGNILDVAKGLISANKQRIEKKIWTVKERGSHIVIHECFTGKEEANFIMEEIDRLMTKKNRMLNDVAIMYRINAQSRALEEACLRYGIRYRIIGGVRFYHRREVKDLISFLRVINNPGDQISLLRVINIPPRGLGTRSIEKIIMCSRREHLSVYEVIQGIIEGNIPEHQLSSRSLKALEGFFSTIEELRVSAGVIDISQTIEMLLEKIGYRNYLEQTGNLEDRWDNILELKGMAQEFISGDSSGDLTALLEHLALVSDVDTLKENSDGITLITLHQAKGLEFPVVFMTGMEEGLLPHYRSMDSEEEIEEERRLCYVGITRAKQELYMTRAFRRGLMGSSGSSIPSRFLQDMPQDLLSSPQLIRQKSRCDQVIKDRDTLEEGVKEIPMPVFKTGDKIDHKIFGNGIIISLSGNSFDQEVVVAFKDAGVKRLLLGYAPIEKV